MAATANVTISKKDDDIGWLPVAASTTLYEGSLAFLTAAGFADDDTATGVNGFAGIVRQYTDNSAGTAGALKVELLRDGCFRMTGSGFTQADVGSTVYAEDSNTIGLSISSASTPIGVVDEYESATAIWVKIKTGGVGAIATAALTTITHTAPSSADYAIQNMTASSPVGFVTVDEANTVLSVIKNLQVRVSNLEARS